MKRIQNMKYIISLFTLAVILVVSCVPTFEPVGELPDNPGIKEVLVGNENGNIPQINAIYADRALDTVFVKDKSVDFSNIYMQVNLEAGCIVKPLQGAPSFGSYGDFSVPGKYRVTAPSGKTADWTIILDYYIPPIGCLADRWVGDVTCNDEVYPSYSPKTCLGEKMNNDCHMVKLTFAFWDDPGSVAVMELQLGEINMDTFKGDITLLNDVNVTYYGSDITFHKGYAGTYNATASELNLSFEFTGYDIGGGRYDFTIRQQ